MKLYIIIFGVLASMQVMAIDKDTCLGMKEYMGDGLYQYKIYCGDEEIKTFIGSTWNSNEADGAVKSFKDVMTEEGYAFVNSFFGQDVLVFSRDQSMLESDKVCLLASWKVLINGKLWVAMGSEPAYNYQKHVDCGYGPLHLNKPDAIGYLADVHGVEKSAESLYFSEDMKKRSNLFRSRHASEDAGLQIFTK